MNRIKFLESIKYIGVIIFVVGCLFPVIMFPVSPINYQAIMTLSFLPILGMGIGLIAAFAQFVLASNADSTQTESKQA
jgi:hypothetical protein